jgi:GntR family transcriptional regulator
MVIDNFLELFMLNSQSPVPLYRQLAEILTAAIESGEFPSGTRITPETTLAANYGIGRPTVRQAVELLVNKGLVQRKRGSGTFVVEAQRKVDLFSLAGTSSAFERLGIKAQKKMLDPVSLAVVNDKPDNPFQGLEAYQFSRLVLAGEGPVLIEDFFLHKALFSGIETLVLEDVSLARMVEDRFYLKPVNGRQTFKIATLSPPRAALLGVGEKTPVLEVGRSIHFPGVKNGIYSKLFCSTDKFSFSQTLGGHSND